VAGGGRREGDVRRRQTRFGLDLKLEIGAREREEVPLKNII
jgi:hypothetical protein